MKDIHFLIRPDEFSGGYVATAMNEGIVTQGESEDEIKDLIIEAVKCHFNEGDIPHVIHLHFSREESLIVA